MSMKRVKNYLFLKEDVLGRGTAGIVYKGVNEMNGEQVAIKIMEMSKIDNEVTQYLLACEKEALITICNPYVLHALQIIQTQDQCLIVTPLCNGGTLKEHIKSKGKLPEQEALVIFVKLLRGYMAIKEKGIVHRDIKSSNVMFCNGEPIIIDFGYCEKLTGKKPKIFYNVGSPSYMSPEAYFKTMYSEKSDLWALGIVLYEMVEGYTIDHGQPIDRYFSSLLKHGFAFRSKLSETMKNMIRSILNPNFNDRPPIQYLIQWIERLIFSGKNTFQNQGTKEKNINNQKRDGESSPSPKISLKQTQRKNQNLLQQKLVQSKEHYEKTKQQFNKLQSPKTKKSENLNPQTTTSPSHVQEGFDKNLIKLSESVYRPERPQGSNTDRSITNNSNMSTVTTNHVQNMQQQNRNAEQRLIEQRTQMQNNLQIVPHRNLLNSHGQNLQPIQYMNNGVPIQFLQMPQNVHQSFVVQPENVNKGNETLLGMNVNKLNPEYKSMIDQPVASNNNSVDFNNKNIKVCHSNIFNVDSMLTLEPNRGQIVQRQNAQLMQQHQQHAFLRNATLTDSVRSRNDSMQSSINSNVNNSLIVPKQNQVVQSLIFDHSRLTQQQQLANQVHKSIIVQPQHQITFFKTQPADFHNPGRPIQSNINTFAYEPQTLTNARGGFVPQQNMPRLNTQQNAIFPQGSKPDQWRNSRPLSPVAAERVPMQIPQRLYRPHLGQNVCQQRNFLKKAEPYFHMNMNEQVEKKQSGHVINSQWVPEQKSVRVQPRVSVTNQNIQQIQQWNHQGHTHFQMAPHSQSQQHQQHQQQQQQHQNQQQQQLIQAPAHMVFHPGHYGHLHHVPQPQTQALHQLQQQVMMNRQTLQNMARNEQHHHQQRISVMQPRPFPRANR